MSRVAIERTAEWSAWQWQAWPLARIAGPALLFAACYVMTLLSDIGTSRYLLDKSWFLHVVNRVTSGDVLYRDVYFPAGPLSVYLTAFFTAPFGNELLVAEAVWSLWMALLILVSLHIARQLGLGDGAPVVLALALIVFMVPWVHSPYTLLAMVWLLMCCSATLTWVSRAATARDQGDRWLVAAGVTVGLCFVSKHNLGAYALAALGGVTATYGGGWANRRQWPRIVALTAGPFLIIVIATFLPVLISGGLNTFMDKFVEYGSTNGEAYLTAARIDYADGLATLRGQLAAVGSGGLAPGLYWQSLYLLPPITALALLAAWPRAGRGERHRVATVLAFLIAAWLVVFPRATLSYVVYVLPIALPGIGYAARLLAPNMLARRGSLLRAACCLWLVVGAVLIVSEPSAIIAGGNYEVSQLPRVRGLLITDGAEPYYHTAERLAKQAGDGDGPFILSTRAGFLYLAGGVKNPTPYDYPLVTTFGRNGLAETIDALRAGDLRKVCLDHDFSSTNDPRRLQPKTILLYVEQEMEPRRDLGTCMLYRGRR